MSNDQVKYANKLANARILVLGGTSGIGFSVAEAAVEAGAASVVVASSNPNRVTSAVQKLQASYPSKATAISGQTCDLGNDSSIEANVISVLEAATSNKTVKLDHVIVTAGRLISPTPITSVDVEMTKFVTGRLVVPLILGKHAQAYMNAGPEASITLTTGSVSQKPFPGMTLLAAGATGLQGICRGLALDLKPMRVNLISPGLVETPIFDGFSEEAKDKLLKDFGQQMALGKAGQPDDVAETYMAAIRDYNMTGTMLSSNGGALIV